MGFGTTTNLESTAPSLVCMHFPWGMVLEHSRNMQRHPTHEHVTGLLICAEPPCVQFIQSTTDV